MKNANHLLQTIETQRNGWDKTSKFKLVGIDNLRLIDIDVIEWYVEEYIKSEGSNFGSLQDPEGVVKDVLDTAGITLK